MTLLGIASFFILMIVGAPIWAAMLTSGGIILVFGLGMPVQAAVSQLFIAIDSWLLLAVPFFLLAGNLMTDMGLAGRLFRFIENLLGHRRHNLRHLRRAVRLLNRHSRGSRLNAAALYDTRGL